MAILTLIKKNGKANYESLAGELNVSEGTIRRDIESLHNNGLFLKVRGGAISLQRIRSASRIGPGTGQKKRILLP